MLRIDGKLFAYFDVWACRDHNMRCKRDVLACGADESGDSPRAK